MLSHVRRLLPFRRKDIWTVLLHVLTIEEEREAKIERNGTVEESKATEK
jgi:hypothetical protein